MKAAAMIPMLILMALIVLLGVCRCYYLSRFSFSSDHVKGEPRVTVLVDTEKIVADEDKVVDQHE